ncbi:hypothetical protein HDU67_008084 [Dinochytrium kinnereticum]|nr:hypothetical protein HDU67_008084 [Dinochytrium kinnereticum]
MAFVRHPPEVIRIENSGDEAQHTTLQLSPMDLFLSAFPLSLLYIFPSAPEGQSYNMDKMKEALSAALRLYPFLSGRFAEMNDPSGPPSDRVIMNNQGARFISATWQDATVDNLVPRGPVRDMSRLSPDLMPPPSPAGELLSIQCTILGCRGLVLGIETSHALLDGEGIFRFVDVLSRCYRGFEGFPVLEHDRSRLFPKENMVSSFEHSEYSVKPTSSSNFISTFTMPPCSHKVFHASKELLVILKNAGSRYISNQDVDTASFVSTLDCLQAHVLSLITIARGITPNNNPIHLNTGINGRKRLEPALSSWFSGNAVFNTLSTHFPQHLCDYLLNPALSLSLTAQKIRCAIRQMSNEYLEDAVCLASSTPGGPSNLTLRAKYFMGSDLLITSWAGMGLRDADFGFGQPRHAGPRYLKEADGFAVFADSEAGTAGSIDIILSLRSEHMAAFEKLWLEPWSDRFV